MKRSVKATFLVVLSVVFVCGMMLCSGCSSSSSSSTPAATTTTYSGTLYQASEAGGHIAVYSVTIDPSNTTTPITVDTATAAKIQLAGAPADSANKIVFHDLKFDDNANPTKIYYSAIMSKPSDTSVAPIGYVNLSAANTAATNNGINSTIDIDGPAADTIAFALGKMAPAEFGTATRILYCGSGMDKTNGYYLPMSMSFPAYVDAVPLAAIQTAGSHVTKTTTGFERTYIDQIDADAAGWSRVSTGDLGTPPLAFIHGGSSPDGSKVYMVMNVVSGLSTTNNLAGKLRGYLVNSSDLEAGTNGVSSMTPAKVVSKGTYTVGASNAATSPNGSLDGTIAYRASFTPDGNYILQSGSDRILILNANDLSLYVDSKTTNDADTVKLGSGTAGGIEVHDVISTPDSKYAILSLRYYTDSTQAAAGGAGNPGIKTSGVQLYDINNKKFIGNVVPTCGSSATQCHPADGDFHSRPTCAVLFKSN